MLTLNIDYRDHSWHSKANKDKQRPLLITKQRNEETINWLKILEICVAPSIPSPAVLSQLLPSRRWGLKIVAAAWPASVSCGTALATVAPGAGKMQLGKISLQMLLRWVMKNKIKKNMYKRLRNGSSPPKEPCAGSPKDKLVGQTVLMINIK